nr:reverse transcriptase domain-containing protein [Tanacetum cinerariifolium]
MSVRLANRSFQYPVGIAKNMLVEVSKFTFPVDFVIREMKEDSKVSLIFIDVIDEILEEDFDALLDEGSKILHSIEGTILEEEFFSEFDKFLAMTGDENYDFESDTKNHHSRKSPSTQIIKSKRLLKNLLRISNSNLFLAKNQKTKSSLKKIVAFTDEGNRNSDTNKIMARMDAMTIKMDSRYKELQSRAKQPTLDLDDDDITMSRKEEAKFMQTFRKTRFYNDYRDRDSNRDNWHSSGWNDYNRDNYRSNTDDKSYDLQRQFNYFIKSQQSTNAFVKETFMDLKTQLETVAKNHQASIQNIETKFNKLADKKSGRPSGSLPSNTQPNLQCSNSKASQPLQSLSEHVNSVFTRSVKSYDPPDNLND